MTFSITLTHVLPQGFWTAAAANPHTRQILGGLFTSAEAALAACWLTTDERISLPTIATYAQVRELLDARMGLTDAEAVEDAAVLLASHAGAGSVVTVTGAQ